MREILSRTTTSSPNTPSTRQKKISQNGPSSRSLLPVLQEQGQSREVFRKVLSGNLRSWWWKRDTGSLLSAHKRRIICARKHKWGFGYGDCFAGQTRLWRSQLDYLCMEEGLHLKRSAVLTSVSPLAVPQVAVQPWCPRPQDSYLRPGPQACYRR